MHGKTVSKYIKENLTDLKGEKYISTIRGRDYITLLYIIDRRNRRKIRNNLEDVNNIIGYQELIDTERIPIQQRQNTCPFQMDMEHSPK